MYQRVKSHTRRTVGLSTTLRALKREIISEVILARDADRRVLNPIVSLCKTQGVTVHWVDCQAALGEACGIPVGASAVGFLREE